MHTFMAVITYQGEGHLYDITYLRDVSLGGDFTRDFVEAFTFFTRNQGNVLVLGPVEAVNSMHATKIFRVVARLKDRTNVRFVDSSRCFYQPVQLP